MITLASASVVLSLALGLSAVPEWTRAQVEEDSYELALTDLRTHIRVLEAEQRVLREELAARAGKIEAEIAQVDELRSHIEAAFADPAILSDQIRDLRDELDARFEAEIHAREAASPNHLRHALREEVLRPVFQITGEDAVGSAVLIHRSEDSNTPHYLALSCWHVVRDILDEREDASDPFIETIEALFDEDGRTQRLEARLLAFDEQLDLALLRLDTQLDLSPVAALAPAERADQIEVFSSVYTVGCPLGTVAQATHGEITHRNWQLAGQSYWMVSSPAYFGNSGGGVFLEESRELVGLFAKIYTHGNYRPQVITHMGLVVPFPVIRAWLESVGYGHILP